MRSAILVAAREWGVPPWEIERGPAHWFLRWMEETRIRQAIKNDEPLTGDEDE